MMRKISLEEMQQIELALLLELDRVCKKHHLLYYIDGGTLLGAMCYEGFIPWDDDIDLKMPRKDYEELLNLDNEFPNHISIYAPSKEHCDYTMLKLIDNRTVLKEKAGNVIKTTGVYLDIFPMDGYPSDKLECRKHFAVLQRLNSLYHNSISDFSRMKHSRFFTTRVKGRFYSLIYSPWKLYRRMTKEAKKYGYDECDYVGLVIEGDFIKERFKKEWLEPGFTLEFEDYRFPAPVGYKKHLEIFYGNHVTKPECYHNLPQYPVQHDHEVYWKE